MMMQGCQMAVGSRSLMSRCVQQQILKARQHCLSLSLRCNSTASSNGHSTHSIIPWLSSLTSNKHSSPVHQPPTDLDAILVLAGGLTPEGGCPPWVQRRLDTAAGLKRLQRKQHCPILCLGGGTPHKPPVLCSDNYVIHEATSCARYLMATHQVEPQHILKEVSSYDTVGNAYFGLTIHALPAGWSHVGVITSDFHMPRTRSLFNSMWAAAAKDVLGQPDRFTLYYAAASDDGLWDTDVIQARHDKEAASTAAWEATVAKLATFQDIHEWLYATHQCYSVSKQNEANRTTIKDARLLASY